MDALKTVKSNKVWGYIAMASGVFAIIGIAMAVKETIDAKRVADVKDAVIEEAIVVAENGGEEGTEDFSGCGGCSSNAIGKQSLKQGVKSSWQF